MAEKKKEDQEIEYLLLTDRDKAAILLSCVGQHTTQMVFSHLKDNDVKRMINSMASIQKVPISMVKRVLEEFYERLNEESELLFSDNRGRDFILRTIGEERARNILGQVMDIGASNSLESLELVDIRTLANFLIGEHPQTIALIISHLKAEKKMEVLRRLPQGLQAEIVLRVANLDYVAPELITQLDSVLKSELSTLGSVDTNQLGGVESIADMLNLMDSTNEKNIMARVEERDIELAEEIKRYMFVFEDLIYVNEKGIQTLLKDIDQQRLVVALKTAPEEVKLKFFKNMSNRASALLKEDLEVLGPTKLSDVEKAQAEIIQKCKDLENQGKLFIERNNDGSDSLV